MTSAVEDVWQALDAAEHLPFGMERSALIESLVAEADRLSDEKLALTARLQLMTSYSYGGEPLRRFPVFAWLLDRFAATPHLFDAADRYRLLWMFKWVTVGVVHHPAVPRSRIEARLDEMAEHFAAAGEGPAPVLGCRYQVTAQLDGYEAAEEAFLAWVAAPRTTLSDCESCEPGIRVRHLVATGRHADALAEAESVLRLGGCADQPQRTIGHTLEPLLQCGFGERAGQEHLRGVRLLRSVGGSPITWARHILACASGGQLHRGLDLLEDRLPDLGSAPTPWDALWLSAAGARLMAGLEQVGDGELPVAGAVSRTGAPATVADLLDQLTGSARALAARFDERNRTTAVGEQVERWLNAPELPALQLGDIVTRRRGAPRPGPRRRPGPGSARRPGPAGQEPDPATPGPNPPDLDQVAANRLAPGPPALDGSEPHHPDPDHADPDRADLDRADLDRADLDHADLDRADPRRPGPDDVAGLPERWQAALDSGIAAQRHDVLELWRRLRGDPASTHLAAAAAARLEAALAIDDLDAGRVSLHDARGAARLLRETGDPLAALLHELTCLRRELARGGDPASVLARAESLVTRGSQLGGPASACLHVGLVALRQLAGEPIGAAVQHALSVATAGDPAQLTVVQRGCLALLLRDLAAGLGGLDREAALERALALLGPGERVRERALVGLALGTSLVDAGALIRARELLAAAADDAVAAADPGLATHTAHALGRACRLAGDLPAAVEVFRDLLTQLGPDADPLLLAQARQDLAHALYDGGRPVDAAELAETALDDLEQQLAGTGLTSPDDLDWAALGEAFAAGGSDTGYVPATSDGAGGGPGTAPGGDTAEPAAATAEPATAELAGTLAFTAALFAGELGEDANACGLAQRSAAWHRGAGSQRAEAESLELAAQTSPDPLEAVGMLHRAGELHARAGRWISAARCHRGLAMPLLEVAGPDAAERALGHAQAALEAARGSSTADPRQLAWERVALGEQAARMLAEAGQLTRALQACQGLDASFRALDDPHAAREAIGLRAQVMEELGRGEECLTELHEAALEARSTGDQRQARQLGGYLAAFLDDLGRHDEADAVWKLFTAS